MITTEITFHGFEVEPEDIRYAMDVVEMLERTGWVLPHVPLRMWVFDAVRPA